MDIMLHELLEVSIVQTLPLKHIKVLETGPVYFFN